MSGQKIIDGLSDILDGRYRVLAWPRRKHVGKLLGMHCYTEDGLSNVVQFRDRQGNVVGEIVNDSDL